MISSLLFGAALGFSANQVMVQDEACNFSIQHDLHVAEHEVVLRDNDAQLWRITDDGELFIHGEQADTNRQQARLLQEYHQGLYSQTENVVEVIAEALDIANFAVATVFNELLGGNADSKISKLQQSISDQLDTVVQKQNNYLIVRGSQLETFGDNLDSVINEEMEALIAESMGNVMMQVGKAMLFGSGNIDERMAAFEQRMESMGEQVETQVETRAAALEVRAEDMCADVQALAAIEQKLSNDFPAFSQYRLFSENRGQTAAK